MCARCRCWRIAAHRPDLLTEFSHDPRPLRAALRSSPAPRGASAISSPGNWQPPALMSSRLHARLAAWRNSTIRSRRQAAKPRWCRSTLPTWPAFDRLGGAIHERWGKLDILVANAGVLGVISPIGHVEAKTFEKVMTINVTSTWRLIRSVDPLLRLLRRRPCDPAFLKCGPTRHAPSGPPMRPPRRLSRR